MRIILLTAFAGDFDIARLWETRLFPIYVHADVLWKESFLNID